MNYLGLFQLGMSKCGKIEWLVFPSLFTGGKVVAQASLKFTMLSLCNKRQYAEVVHRTKRILSDRGRPAAQ